MKIGILTLPLHTNYGGILQAYALQAYLEQLGYEVRIIDGGIYSKYSLLIDILRCGKYILHHLLNLQLPHLSECKAYNYRKISHFVKSHIHLSKSSIEDIKEQDFDAIIVGSDQIWRKKYVKQNLLHYFLDFTRYWSIKRISYAASFGTKEIEYSSKEIESCRAMLLLFSGVSVREHEGSILCKEHFNRSTKVLIDPTMLLHASHYRNLINKKQSLSSGLVTYMLDPSADKYKAVQFLEKIIGCKAFHNGKTNTWGILHSIEEWLHAFDCAKFVFTDSFHGCVFSIIFNKPFIAYANRERGISRFETLLRHFGLDNRLVYDTANIKNISLSPIDWNIVNSRLANLQIDSHKFITEALDK